MSKSQYYVIGRNAVIETLKASSDRIDTLLIASKKNLDTRAQDILESAKKLAIKVEYLDFQRLTSLVQSDSHQSVALAMKNSPELNFSELKVILSEDQPQLVIALDGIEDPHNLGSVLRVAECFQASAVIWSDNRGVNLTPTVTKVSCGASELVPIATVKNLRTSLQQLKETGFWIVAAALTEASTSIYSFEFPQKTVLVLGAEQKGVSQLILKESDFQVLIPMHGQIDSLNVAQSAAVFLSEWQRKNC